VKETEYSWYKCKNGLIDVAMPIIIQNKHQATLFTGQFFFEPPDKDFFVKQADEFEFDKVAYLNALSEVPVFTKEKIESGVKFLVNIAKLLGEMGLRQKNLLNLSDELEEKVEKRTAELKEKSKEAEQFVYQASHDLRSPMVNIKGFTSLLEKNLEKISSAPKEEFATLLDKDIPENINFIKRSISKVDALLEGFSEISKIGRRNTAKTELDINKLIHEVKSNHEILIKEKGATVEIEDLPLCRGDEKQINQIFSNLMGNALKYLCPNRKGLIRIDGKREDGNAIYCVHDNGIGIGTALHNRVFEMFHQIKPNSSEGEGLGLAIVKKIASKHDGNVWVESELDKGSKFFVSLPTQ